MEAIVVVAGPKPELADSVAFVGAANLRSGGNLHMGPEGSAKQEPATGRTVCPWSNHLSFGT